jgi:hypothetical protein
MILHATSLIFDNYPALQATPGVQANRMQRVDAKDAFFGVTAWTSSLGSCRFRIEIPQSSKESTMLAHSKSESQEHGAHSDRLKDALTGHLFSVGT